MLTPGLVEKKQRTAPIAGSNNSVYARAKDPIEKLRSDTAKRSNDDVLALILRKERALAKNKIRSHGENIRNVIELADIHFLNGKYSRAREVYLNALKLDSKNVAVYKKLINCYIALGSFDLASQYYDKLVEVRPSAEFRHERVLFQLATVNGDPKGLERIQKDIRQLAKDNPSDDKIINTHGLILGFVQQNHEASKAMFQKAIELNAKNFHAVNNLGVYYKSKRDFSKALVQFQKAIELNPRYAAGYENIASTYIDKEEYEKALRILELAAKRNVKLSELWLHKVGWLLIVLGQYDEAIKWHEKKIKEEPTNDLLLNNLGHCYQEIGRYSEAEKCYKAAIDCFEKNVATPAYVPDGRSVSAFRNLMVLANDLDKSRLLDITAKRLLAVSPGNPMALFYRGQAQQKLKNYIFAKECFLDSIASDPTQLDSYINLSFIYEIVDKDYEKAIALIENAPFRPETEQLILNNLAYAYVKSGKPEKAGRLLLQIKGTKHPSVYATLGLIELYKDKFNNAELNYKKAISNFQHKDKKFAQQVWEYEQAYFWVKKKDYAKANERIEASLALGDASYAYDLTNELKNRVKNIQK